MTDRVLPRAGVGTKPGDPGVTPGAEQTGHSTAGNAIAPVVVAARVTAPWAAATRRATAPTAAAARFAKPRGEAWFGPATRAGVLVGVSAAIYAVSLASVAGLQSASTAQAVADTQPGLDAVARAKAANDEIEAQLKDADTRLQALAHDYDATTTDLSAYQAQFQQLSSLVAKIQGSAAALNTNFKLPSVTIHGSVGGSGGGSTVTTTGGSGKP
jgi:hypothetical protein